ncbi:MAG TPA: hypothetical protein PKY13_08800 [Microthrixaceae bacterium]|nr:hypothetical protein [Microthrixaceae bacterium]
MKSIRFPKFMIAAAVIVGAASITTAAPASASTVTGSDVTVSRTVKADQSAPCVDPLFSLSNYVNSTADAFTLTVNVNAPLCSPLEAKAVIYAMPGDGVAWPQELVKTVPFTLSEAGTVTVTFSKGCGATQFDVITGHAPQTINTGFDHGPLLFPAQLQTAQQFWGARCVDETTTTSTVPATTSTVPTSSTTTAATSTSTTAAEAKTTTTAASADVNISATSTVAEPTTTLAIAVAGQSVDNPVPATSLAFTGSATNIIAALAIGLVLIGISALVIRERRNSK